MIFTNRMSNSEIKAEYTSSLADLTVNSKPLISVLTMLAEENIAHASDIVAAIEEHLAKVQTSSKLPILYLIDCIVKNVGQTYTSLFSQNIVVTFCSVFKVVDEETRAEMFKLRQTWNNIFPQKKLYAIDVQISMLDPAWPVTAQAPSNKIHFNPKFLNPSKSKDHATATNSSGTKMDVTALSMQQELFQKQQELLELQQKKVELELLQTQVKLQKQLESSKVGTGPNNLQSRSQNILLKPEVAKQLMPETAKPAPHTLLREMKEKQLLGSTARSSQPRITPVNSALATAMKPTRDPRLLRQRAENKTSNGTNSSTVLSLGSKSAILDSNNKVITNTKSIRDNSRIESRLVNKDNILSSPKPDHKLKFLKSNQKLLKPRKINVEVNSKFASLNKNSVINLTDSPPKIKSDKGEKFPTKLPSRHKKKEHLVEKKLFKDSSKRDRELKVGRKEDAMTMNFKGVKSLTKVRNFRRNRSPSFSPEPESSQDIDLRVSAPPEKIQRIQNEPEEKRGLDLDLRHNNEQQGNKKRLSSDNIEAGSSKKQKTQDFDTLFGNEDTDLRTVLPVAQQPDRPPTPPPPIISSDKEKEREPLKNTSDFDAIRAKLANATGRDKIMAKSFHKKRLQEDEDFRMPQSRSTDMQKIIISSDDEQCIKAGTLTKQQEQQLLKKIIAQMEQQKLTEAQLKDKQDNLQPVSDDELEVTEETGGQYGDQDDRVNFRSFSRDTRDSRRGTGSSYWRGAKRRHWENPHPRPSGIRPWLHPANAWRPMGPNFNKTHTNNEFTGDYSGQELTEGTRSPEVSADMVVDSVNLDDIKTINIDGVPRDIRYYDETAIVFMSPEDPREISFQNGSRRVIFDENDVYLLSFNESYKEVSINGAMHRVRLGAPSREIFIDGKPYECYFGGPGITIDLGGKTTLVKLDGPPPQVKIGTDLRTDLVSGKVHLIIDAKILVVVYLDAKLQKFVIDDETHTLKFVDALKTVLINDVPFKVEFGGLPKPITVHDKKHFIRFSVLPKGVKPGQVALKDMEGAQLPENDDSQDGSAFHSVDSNEPALPITARKKKVDEEPDRNSNSPQFFQNFLTQNNLDMLSSVMTSSLTPLSNTGGYQVENLPITTEPTSSSTATPAAVTAAPYVAPVQQLPPALNINDLFQKLVATGIVASKEPEAQPPKPSKRNILENLKPVNFSKPETLKIRQNRLYEILYSGMQCSSCGMRFPPEQSMLYSQHLDWHFRQNRKGKKNIRVAASRRWYYSLADWKNYEEIEDIEEREKNYFEQQQQQTEGVGDEPTEDVEEPSVPADPDVQDPRCTVCQDKFDYFFNEEKEEWHLKNAIRIDGKTYHPVCFDDYQASLQEPFEEAKEEVEETQDEEKTDDTNIPGLEIILDDDDDDDDNEVEDEEKQQRNQELNDADEVIIDESDESKHAEEEETKVDEPLAEDDGDDDDVIINEVVPEKIEVDDDREYLESPSIDLPIKVEQIDDGFVDVEEGLITIKTGNQIQIKSEPVDPDEEVQQAVRESTPPPAFAETTSQPAFISSIDGNIDPTSNIPTTSAAVGNKIKINISKPLPVISHKEPKDISCDSVPILDSVIDPSQPLPPGEEPVQLNIKPALRGLKLKKLPTVKKGSELTGMCSIM